MIRLIVVEDEPLMNKFIVNSINWNDLAIELCGTFFNGKTAYEYISKNNVDVVLSDIQMPIMDGLELIEKTVADYPDIKFIFLSNFDDFHMVKKAFQFGASDYILKADFSEETFLEIFLDVTKKLKPNRENPTGNHAMREHTLKEYFWGGIISKSNQERFRVNMQGELSVAVLRLLNYEEILDGEWNSERENMKFGLSNFIDEILEKNQNGDFFFNEYDEIVFVFSLPEAGGIAFEASSLFDEIISILNTHFNLNAVSAIYDCKDSCSIKEQYRKVRDSLQYSIVLGINKLISTDEIMSYKDTFEARDYAVRVKTLIKSFGFKELCKELEAVADLKPGIEYIDSFRKFYLSIINNLKEVFDEFLVDTSEQKLFAVKIDCFSAFELNVMIEKATQHFMAQLASSDIAVMKIQNYVYENYSENITLQFLAEKFSFDYAGLSRRFQKVAGTTFPKFLNEIRLNEAMKLIRITDHKISSIASMVGYNNYESFSRNFKNKFKRWPNEIRKEESHE